MVGTSLTIARRFYRIPDWFHFLGFTVLGILFGMRAGEVDVLACFGVMIACSLLLAFAFSFNVFYDSELSGSAVDSYAPLFGSHHGSLVLSLLPAAAGLALLSWSLSTFLLGFLFALAWASYSFPAPRLKAVPLVCTVTNGTGFSLLFLIGFASVSVLTLSSFLLFFVLVLLEIPGQLVHEVAHAGFDKSLRVNTTTVRYGKKRSFDLAISSLVGAASLATAMFSQRILNGLAGLLIGSFATVFALVLLFNRSREANSASELRKWYRLGGIVVGSLLAIAFLP